MLRSLLRFLLVLALAAGWLALAVHRGLADSPRGLQRRPLDPLTAEVVDGDTLRIDGQELRILGVDTPEKSAPWFAGDQEPHASRARDRLQQLLDQPGARPALLWRGRRDTYGRPLVHVEVAGRTVAETLVAEGLGYETVSRFGDGGFPAQAEAILKASQGVNPDFEPPWKWRKGARAERR